MDDHFNELLELLAHPDIRPSIASKRIAKSFYYDAVYQTAIIALCFSILGTTSELNGKLTLCINSAYLNLCQFIAIRSNLLIDLQRWKELKGKRHEQPLDKFLVLPRGFFTDPNFRDVIRFLIATNALALAGPKYIHFLKSDTGNILTSLLEQIESDKLFEAERRTLSAIKELKISQKELGIE